MLQIKAIRHGEVMLLPVAKLPNGKTKGHTNYIVGHSETGHHHVLESTTEFDVMLDNAMLYIQLYEPAQLVHKKTVDQHKTLTVPAGTYKILHDTEYDPWSKVIRAVQD